MFFYHPCPSRLASGIHHYFFKLLGVLSLSRMLVEFSNLRIPPCVGTIFQFMVFTLENALNLRICTHCSVSHSKLQMQFFENLFSPRTKNKGVEETKICVIKNQLENMKMTWNISLFIFCMIYNFSKCDGLTVLWIISIKQCGIKFNKRF